MKIGIKPTIISLKGENNLELSRREFTKRILIGSHRLILRPESYITTSSPLNWNFLLNPYERKVSNSVTKPI